MILKYIFTWEAIYKRLYLKISDPIALYQRKDKYSHY